MISKTQKFSAKCGADPLKALIIFFSASEVTKKKNVAQVQSFSRCHLGPSMDHLGAQVEEHRHSCSRAWGPTEFVVVTRHGTATEVVDQRLSTTTGGPAMAGESQQAPSRSQQRPSSPLLAIVYL